MGLWYIHAMENNTAAKKIKELELNKSAWIKLKILM